MHLIPFMKKMQFIGICILEIYYIYNEISDFVLAILDFADLQTNHQQAYMEIFLTWHLKLFLEKNILLSLIFIVLQCLCGKFHLDNHLLVIMNMMLILQ